VFENSKSNQTTCAYQEHLNLNSKSAMFELVVLDSLEHCYQIVIE